MARYIDVEPYVEWLKKEIEQFDKPNPITRPHSHGCVLALESVLCHAQELPTADVVEVVRCKDCKHWDESPDSHRTDGICNELVKWHSAEKYMTEADHFCGYGKRK